MTSGLGWSNSLVGRVALPLVGLADSIGSLGLGRAASLPYERSESHEGRRPMPYERSESYEGRRPESYERSEPHEGRRPESYERASPAR